MRSGIFAAAFLAATLATAQEGTPTPAPIGTEQVDSGTVVNYEQGRNIVIRRADGSQAIYPVASNILWPPDLKMYGWANVYYTLFEDGGFHVTRLTTLPPTPTPIAPTPAPIQASSPPPPPPPSTATTAAKAEGPKGAPVQLLMEDAATVTAYEKGRRLTVRQKDGTRRTYLLDSSSVLPPRLAVKQKVIVETKTVRGKTVVARVVYPEIVISNVPKSK